MFSKKKSKTTPCFPKPENLTLVRHLTSHPVHFKIHSESFLVRADHETMLNRRISTRAVDWACFGDRYQGETTSQSPNLDTPCPTRDLPPSQPPRTHRSPPSSRHLESFLVRVDHETMLNRRISMSTMTRHFLQLKLIVNRWYNRKKSGFAGSPRSITKPMIFVFSMVFWTVPCTVTTYKHAQWTYLDEHYMW